MSDLGATRSRQLDTLLRAVDQATVMGGRWEAETPEASGLAGYARLAGLVVGGGEQGFEITARGRSRVRQTYPDTRHLNRWSTEVIALVTELAARGGTAPGALLMTLGPPWALRRAFEGGLLRSTTRVVGTTRVWEVTLRDAGLRVARREQEKAA